LEILKKSIILSPASCDGKSEEKGILTLQKELGEVKGVLKCFELKKMQGKLLLGITFNDNKLNKFELKDEDTCVFRFSIPSKSLEGDISCVIVAMNKDNHTPILWGSTITNQISKSQILKSVISSSFTVNTSSIKENLYLEEEVREEINSDEVKEENFFMEEETKKLKNMEQKSDFEPYKEIFKNPDLSVIAEQTKKLKEDNSPSFKLQEEVDETTFYDEVKEQIDSLFEKYEKEVALEEMIPNSSFVRVTFDTDGESYVFGIIFDDNNEPEYIVYGIPSSYQKLPPKQLEGYYQWLPLDPNNPEEDGYFLMYQDATTGEHVKVEIV